MIINWSHFIEGFKSHWNLSIFYKYYDIFII